MTVARLQGRLHVLLAFHEELHAIGAPALRLERNRDELERVRAELARAKGRGTTGDLTDATGGAGS